MRKFQNRGIIIVLFSLVLVLMCQIIVKANVKTIKASIGKINDINIVTKQNAIITLPKTIIAIMTDKTKKNVSVIWNIKSIDTSKEGITTYYGTVKDYKNKVKLTVNVIPIIMSVNDIKISIKQNENYELPNTIPANMSDGSIKFVKVIWNGLVDTKSPGTKIYEGTIKGFNYGVNLSLNILPIITSIQDINITINTNQKFVLPTNIDAVFSDNTINEVNVEWNPNVFMTNRGGTYSFEGVVPGYESIVILNLKIINIYSNINDLYKTVINNEKYSLPETITASMTNGTTTEAGITWDTSDLDTGKTGTIIVEGTVVGYEGRIKDTINIISTITSIQDKSFVITEGDEYTLPKTVQATMSDGVIKDVEILWNPAKLDLSKVGTIDVIGKVEGYDKDIHWIINVKTNFTLTANATNYSQWGYIPISFSKNILTCANVNKIILTDENGVKINIKSGVPGNPDKFCFLIFPSHDLQKNMKYTITIPKDTIQSENGEYYSEDIIINFQN
jgi:hypothetical protein